MRLPGWGYSRYNLALMPYYPRSSASANDATTFIIALKENDPRARALAFLLLAATIGRFRAVIQDQYRRRYLVTIPSHEAGRYNVPCEDLCRALTRAFPWLAHVPTALRRVDTVRKSAAAPPGQRPTYEDHRRTIQRPPERVARGRGDHAG